MNIELSEEEMAALVLLKRTGVPALEAAHVAYTAIKSGKGRTKRALRCIAAGAVELKKQERTVSFEKAVAFALEARRERRARTVYDFRYFTRRFMKRCPGLARRKVRAISPQECAAYIETAFDTPRQRQKARLILSGVFGTAIKRGWCSSNPVAQVDLQAGAIYIHPQHSKTGGARRVTIHKPLQALLHRHRPAATTDAPICPPRWLQHWRRLRHLAGWNTPAHRWPQDALRHTFASYHLSYFRSYAELQLEIGHRDASLLRTRYVDQSGVEDAKDFWNYELPVFG